MESDRNPFVSICIPCYKYPDLIERCLHSVLEQTYGNFEIIVTDDSPDDTIADLISRDFDDPRVIYQKNPVRLGSPANWNEATRLAKGRYIKIMNHDDWFASKDALARFVEAAITNDADFVFSNCIDHFPDKKRKHRVLDRLINNLVKEPERVIFGNFIGAPSVTFYKRPEGINPLFDEKTMWFVDVLFYFEFIREGRKKVIHINEYLLNITAGSHTQVTNSAIDASIIINEFDYISTKFRFYERYDFMTKLYLTEILKRYKIQSRAEFEKILGRSFERKLPYFLLKLPIHHQCYNVLKYILLLA